MPNATPIPMSNRRAPVQASRRLGKPDGTIAWSEHESAWTAYSRLYGRDQSAVRIAQRGGFGYTELLNLLGHEPTTWEPL